VTITALNISQLFFKVSMARRQASHPRPSESGKWHRSRLRGLLRTESLAGSAANAASRGLGTLAQ